MSTYLTRMPQTEFGMPHLDDMTTNGEWWSHLDDTLDARPNVSVVLSVLETDGPAWPERLDIEGVREPDLFDDGCAFWLTGRAVVSCDMDHVDWLPEIVNRAARVRIHDNGLGWTRIHPAHYGVEVNSFFTHNGEPAPHTAHEAWRLLAEATTTTKESN